MGQTIGFSLGSDISWVISYHAGSIYAGPSGLYLDQYANIDTNNPRRKSLSQ